MLARMSRGASSPPRHPARSVLFFTVVATMLGAFASVASAQSDELPPFGVAEGMTAPDFTMLDLDGEPVTLSELRGTPVLLNFWASWCPPCVAELPLLDRAARELDGTAHIVLLNVGEPHDVVGPFLDDLGVGAATVLRDAREAERPVPDGVVPSRAVAQVYQTFGLPTSLLLDRRGVIVARVSGPVDEPRLDALLARAGVDRAP
jgi:thiol-disulfide isomerase/thioredoxin